MRFSTTQGVIIMTAAFALLVLGFTQHKPSTEDGETIDISDWVEYRNEEFGFVLQHPADWLILSVPSDDWVVVVFRKVSTQESIEGGNITPRPVDELEISRWDDINNYWARGGSWEGMWEYADLADYFTDPGAMKQKTGNIKGATWTGNEVIISTTRSGSSHGVMIEQDGLTELNFDTASHKGEMSSEQVQVLSTFEFIDE